MPTKCQPKRAANTPYDQTNTVLLDDSLEWQPAPAVESHHAQTQFEIFQIFEGTNQIQRVVIGRNIAQRSF